jgi:hypothetical protein
MNVAILGDVGHVLELECSTTAVVVADPATKLYEPRYTYISIYIYSWSLRVVKVLKISKILHRYNTVLTISGETTSIYKYVIFVTLSGPETVRCSFIFLLYHFSKTPTCGDFVSYDTINVIRPYQISSSHLCATSFSAATRTINVFGSQLI